MATVNVWELDSCANTGEKQIPFATRKVERHITVADQQIIGLTEVSYTPGANNLAVYVQGVLQSLEAGDYVELSTVAYKFAAPLEEGLQVVSVVNDYETTVPDLKNTKLTIKGSDSTGENAFGFLFLDNVAELQQSNPFTGPPRALVWGFEALGDSTPFFYYFDANSEAVESIPNVVKPTVAAVGRWILLGTEAGQLNPIDPAAKHTGCFMNMIATQRAPQISSYAGIANGIAAVNSSSVSFPGDRIFIYNHAGEQSLHLEYTSINNNKTYNVAMNSAGIVCLHEAVATSIGTTDLELSCFDASLSGIFYVRIGKAGAALAPLSGASTGFIADPAGNIYFAVTSGVHSYLLSFSKAGAFRWVTALSIASGATLSVLSIALKGTNVEFIAKDSSAVGASVLHIGSVNALSGASVSSFAARLLITTPLVSSAAAAAMSAYCFCGSAGSSLSIIAHTIPYHVLSFITNEHEFYGHDIAMTENGSVFLACQVRDTVTLAYGLILAHMTFNPFVPAGLQLYRAVKFSRPDGKVFGLGGLSLDANLNLILGVSQHYTGANTQMGGIMRIPANEWPAAQAQNLVGNLSGAAIYLTVTDITAELSLVADSSILDTSVGLENITFDFPSAGTITHTPLTPFDIEESLQSMDTNLNFTMGVVP